MDILRVTVKFGRHRLSECEYKSYIAGFDCAKNGANTVNCDYRHFASKRQTEAWEKGKADGDKELRAKQ